MRLKFAAATFAAIATLAVASVPADAQSTQRRATVDARGNTVFVSRDEDGRKRTRVIIQKRSYLDPGTEVLPGSRHDLDYAQTPNHRADGVLNNTVFGSNQSPLPGPFELGFGKNNPFLRF